MLPAVLALATISSVPPVGLHLEEVGELPLESAVSVMSSLSRVLERETGATVVFDDPSWSRCDADDRCISDVRARTQATEIVFARVFGGPSLVYVSLERVGLDAKAAKTTNVELPKTEGGWDTPLANAARVLFPELKPEARAEGSLTAAPVIDEGSVRAGPWIVLGAGVAAGTAGALLGVSSADAKTELESSIHIGAEYDALSDRMKTHGLAANVLFGVAATAVVTSVVWLIVQ
ncbi:hypothetical protein L6R52_34810 [Myxococcota bacterium]|nr:hypothetical protein [Myxococcota bacterium]